MKTLNMFFQAVEWKATMGLFLLIFAVGCSGTKEIISSHYSDDGYYKNNVNSKLLRQQIDEGFESVLRIQNNVIYRTYQFYDDDMPAESEVKKEDLDEIAVRSYLDDQSTAGTAIVISEYQNKYALLTAAHTVIYPDTVWHFSDLPSEEGEKQVRAVSVKRSVNYFVLMEGGIIKLEVGAYDTHRDLAVMINTDNPDGLLTPLSIPFGDANQLQWADMIYALGYPKGAKMVTMGVASRSDHPTRSILIDASFNRGFSGGALFAVRNDGAGLEFMGVVTSALGENETFLIPHQAKTEDYNPELPYKGEVFVRTTPRINYGITNAVSVNEVQAFLRENQRKLNEMGVVIP